MAEVVGYARKQGSKAIGKDKFVERKTQKSMAEETCGLAESDRSKEGPLIGGQGLQDEELGVGLGEG